MTGRAFGKWLISATVLAIVLLWVSVRGVDWHDLWLSLQRARLSLVALSLALVNASLFLRAVRWRVLILAKHPATLLAVFRAVSLGYLGNSLLPARAGDVVRSVVIKRKSRISFSYAFATTLTERLMDLATLVLIGLLAAATAPDLASWLVHTTSIMAAIAGAGVLALFALPRLEGTLAALVARTPLAKYAQTRLGSIARESLLGLRALQDPARALRFGSLTVTVWLIDALAVMAVASSLSLSLSLGEALLLLAALGLSSAAPSTPGYIGIYQFVAAGILMPLGFTRSHALAFIFLYQGVVYLVVLFWGAAFLSRSRGLWLEITQRQGDRFSAAPVEMQSG